MIDEIVVAMQSVVITRVFTVSISTGKAFFHMSAATSTEITLFFQLKMTAEKGEKKEFDDGTFVDLGGFTLEEDEYGRSVVHVVVPIDCYHGRESVG